ncbi:glycosyltransferase family 2 protein [Salininema proteolyticum]|uniref:Glycosyltransferase family 2 protein n=1 Tax=Salininema proteolyticum TaxID=1607685 RepID=A0ABV8TXA2_9ACTN
MPLLSVVVPVFKADRFLPQCLRSVTVSSTDSLEVIVVDDCSPDKSAEIAAEFSASDPRVRLVRTEQNGGSGAARNRGLAEARGEYVWFVDADDRVAPGAVDLILDRIRAGAPDLLLVQHSRITSDGVVRTAGLPELAASAPVGTDSFTLEEWPGVLPYTHTPWTKVTRRTVLSDDGPTFPSGWYTDIPWTYGLLRRVEAIGLVLEECYEWHQRPDSSITLTQDRKHFDVFLQWERTWEDWEGVADAGLRRALFSHMVWHLLIVMGNTDRISNAQRRDFFHRAHELCEAHRPEGWDPRGLKQKLLAGRSYRTYEVFRRLWRVVRRLRDRGRTAHTGVPVQADTAPAPKGSGEPQRLGKGTVNRSVRPAPGSGPEAP